MKNSNSKFGLTAKLSRTQMKSVMGGEVALDMCKALGLIKCSCNGGSFCVSSVSDCATLCGVPTPA